MRIDYFATSKCKDFKSFKEAEAYLKLKIEKDKGKSSEKKMSLNADNELSNIGEAKLKKATRQKKNIISNFDQENLVINYSIDRSESISSDSSNESIIHSDSSKSLSGIILTHDIKEDRVIVYTDGSCKKHGERRIAGLGVYWNDDCPLNISEKYDGVQTNNRAEIAAIIEAVRVAHQYGIRKLLIRTDSMFVINCMTRWMANWKLNNWILSNNKHVECREELQKLDNLIIETNINIKWEHVAAHGVDNSNNKADLLANMGADKWLG